MHLKQYRDRSSPTDLKFYPWKLIPVSLKARRYLRGKLAAWQYQAIIALMVAKPRSHPNSWTMDKSTVLHRHFPPQFTEDSQMSVRKQKNQNRPAKRRGCFGERCKLTVHTIGF